MCCVFKVQGSMCVCVCVCAHVCERVLCVQGSRFKVCVCVYTYKLVLITCSGVYSMFRHIVCLGTISHSVGYHSHNGIGAQRIIINAIKVIGGGTDDWSLWGLKPVHLKVHSVRK